MDDTSRGAAGFGSTGTSVLTSPSPLLSTFVFSILKYQMMAHIAGCMLYYAFTRAACSYAITVWAIQINNIKIQNKNPEAMLNALLFGKTSSPVYTPECAPGLRNGVPAMYCRMVDHLLHEYEGVTHPYKDNSMPREPSQPRRLGAGRDLSDQAWWDSSSECGTEEMNSDEDTVSESSVSVLRSTSKPERYAPDHFMSGWGYTRADHDHLFEGDLPSSKDDFSLTYLESILESTKSKTTPVQKP